MQYAFCADIVNILRTHTAYDLATAVYFNLHKYNRRLLRVLDLREGRFAAKVFITMFERRDVWRTRELVDALGVHRSYVNRALRELEDNGFVRHISRGRWRIVDESSTL